MAGGESDSCHVFVDVDVSRPLTFDPQLPTPKNPPPSLASMGLFAQPMGRVTMSNDCLTGGKDDVEGSMGN